MHRMDRTIWRDPLLAAAAAVVLSISRKRKERGHVEV